MIKNQFENSRWKPKNEMGNFNFVVILSDSPSKRSQTGHHTTSSSSGSSTADGTCVYLRLFIYLDDSHEVLLTLAKE